MSYQLKQINAAVRTIDQILHLLDEAKDELMSARKWVFFDMMGGGFFSTAVKHKKMRSASSLMDTVGQLLDQLKRQLSYITFPCSSNSYNIHTSQFATFVDFFMDGFFIDAYMMRKIFDNIDKVNDLEKNLLNLRQQLTRIP